MADSCCIVELKETIGNMNAELGQSHTKISELDAKVWGQEKCLLTAQKEMAKLQEENARLDRDLKEGNAQLARDLKEENAQLARDLKEGNSQLARDLKEGNAELARDLKEGNAQLARDLKEEIAQLARDLEENARLARDLKEENARLARDLKEENARLAKDLKEENAQLSRDLIEENARLARDLKKSEEKCRTVQEKCELAEQKLAQFSQKPDATAKKSLTQVNETNDDAFDINALPNEIILKIFSYLTHNQLGQIARVCRRWNVLTKSPLLWRKVNVKIFSTDRRKNAKERRNVAKSFLNGLPSCVTFIRLDFSKCEDLDFKALCVKLHQNCPRVEELILFYLGMSYLLPEVLNFCTQFLQCVKKLVFHYCGFSICSRTVELNDKSKIEVLDLYGCDLKHFSKTQFSKLLCLKELRLAVTEVDDTWFKDDASFFNQLQVLDLGGTFITARTFLTIQNHGHNLKELYLCYSNLLDSDLNFNIPRLKTICVAHTWVNCEAVVSLIRKCLSLQNVYVNETVSDVFAEHPFALANTCKSEIVKSIDFDHNHNVDYSHN